MPEPFRFEGGEALPDFTVTCLDGSEFTLSRHRGKTVVINLWATWCGPCVRELKELQAIHTRFLEKDCAIVGLLTDQDVNTARQLLKQNGVDYTVVIAPKDIRSIFPYEGIPTSFFVDSNGAYLGTTITGAYTDQYEPALNSLLAQGN